MPTEMKQKIKFYAILGGTVILLAALITGLCMLIIGKNAQPITQTPPSTEPAFTTAPTEPTLPPSPYAPGDFTYSGDFLTCLTAETMLGIDVSHHQGDIDWTAVKAAGIDFAMVRLGYRSQAPEGILKTDRCVRQNLQGAREAGLLVGAYFYSQAVSEAEAAAEAEYALSILGDFQLDLPLAYDWEQEKRTENVGVDTLTGASLVFCRGVEQAGHRAMIYFNSYQAENLADMSRLQQYPWWLAMYSTADGFPCRFDVWQYTCTGTVPGIAGDVDVNLLMPDGAFGYLFGTNP